LAQSARQGLKETPALLALRGPPVQLDPKVPPVHKGQRETPALPVRQVPPERLDFQERLVLLAQRGLPAQLDPKALRDLLDRVEGLAAGRSFKATALSWCRLESAG